MDGVGASVQVTGAAAIEIDGEPRSIRLPRPTRELTRSLGFRPMQR